MTLSRSKIPAFLVFLSILLVITGCQKEHDINTSVEQTESQVTEALATEDYTPINQSVIVKDSEYSVCAAVSKSNVSQNYEAVESLQLNEKTDESTSVLIRIPLPTAIQSSSIVSSELRLKKIDGGVFQIRVSAITSPWDRLSVNWETIKDYLVSSKTVNEILDSNGDWYTIDITEITKMWMNGEVGQFGLLLEAVGDDVGAVFYSTYDTEHINSIPEIRMTYIENEEKESFGSFTYEAIDQGNCLSYALRDKDAIQGSDLGLDYDKIEFLYNEQGLNAVVDYVKGLTVSYAMKHSEALKISQFHEIEDFSEDIDSATTYRVAMRVGVSSASDGSFEFDYHWQVQNTNGSWSEKFSYGLPRFVPGSNGGLDPSLYPWDQNEYWGTQKWMSFYNSDVTYFKVEKLSEFTSHRNP